MSDRGSRARAARVSGAPPSSLPAAVERPRAAARGRCGRRGREPRRRHRAQRAPPPARARAARIGAPRTRYEPTHPPRIPTPSPLTWPATLSVM